MAGIRRRVLNTLFRIKPITSATHLKLTARTTGYTFRRA